MLINEHWRKLAKVVVEKSWGREDWLVNTPDYCAKVLTVRKGQSGSYHYHKVKDETFLVLYGEVALVVGAGMEMPDTIVMKPGNQYHLSAKTPHLLFGISDTPAEMLEVSTHHREDDVVRIWEPSRDTEVELLLDDVLDSVRAAIILGEEI